MEEGTSANENIDADLCPICLDVFLSPQELLKHVLETYHVSSISSCSMTLESCDDDTVCPLCLDSVFEDAINLLKHMFANHSVSFKEECSWCLAKHKPIVKEEIDENVDVKVESCETKIKQEIDESVTVKIENYEPKIKIEENLEDDSLLKSFTWEYNANVKCEDLSESIKSEQNVNNESFENSKISPENHQVDLVMCSICEVCFKTEDELSIHNENNHWNKCSYCSESFQTVKQLEEHIDEKHPYKCDLCDKCFQTNGGLVTHKKWNHEVCNKCNIYFKTKEELVDHANNGHIDKESAAAMQINEQKKLEESSEDVRVKNINSPRLLKKASGAKRASNILKFLKSSSSPVKKTKSANNN